ncbi:hypothetical protein GOBAR_DD29045 [Gossypium barbadense]|nr:hypothetical protein GOBAR_DD29045 [Gossypium barbadense]
MVFRNMNEGGILSDLTTYSYLVETFGKLGKLEKAYANSGSIKEAMGVFRQMQAAGCVPNAATYSILLNLYGRNGRYDDVSELFLQMKASNTEPDAATYNILIQVFGKRENVEPNMKIYDGLIFACGKGGLHEDAKKILLHMNEKGIAALYEEALVAFNTMNEVESKPTIETYNSLLQTFARGGLHKEAEAILSGLRGSIDYRQSVTLQRNGIEQLALTMRRKNQYQYAL